MTEQAKCRLLLDSCVWGGAAEALAGLGWDVLWVPASGPDPGDDAVLAWAARESRVLVTLDKDFGELVHNRGHKHAGIVRIQGFAAREQAGQIAYAVQGHVDELQGGALLVVTPQRLRVRLGNAG
jgi:predicted nuclease of predicted toxin-antitoxin system